MPVLNEHPTVQRFFAQPGVERGSRLSTKLDGDWLRHLCLEAGADDAGFVEIDRPELAGSAWGGFGSLSLDKDAPKHRLSDEP